MGGQQPTPEATESVAERSADARDLLLRNHDFQWGYDLEVEVRAADGGIVHETRSFLPPGATRSVPERLTPGEYDVRVVLDDRRAVSATVGLGDGVDEGILIECGNGAVSVHDRLFR